MSGDGPGKLESLIADISAFDRAECLNRWREVFMKRVLIWETQNETLGGVSIKTTRRLNQIASGKSHPAATKPGSHLIREWNGRTYQVEVVEGGYVMDGKTWPSLSAIARHITGARWSGPRFFGVQ